MPLRTLPPALLLMGSLVLPAHAVEGGKKPTAEVVRSGVCLQENKPRRYDVPPSTSASAKPGRLRIDRQTSRIPLEQGIGFGFAWKATGLPPEGMVAYVIEHPEFVRPDGTTATAHREEFPFRSRKGTINSVDCYMLTEKYEVVPGTWTLSILFEDQVLVRRSYKLGRAP
jgi:hypothetical protein